MSNRRTTDVQNRTVMVVCIVLIVAAGLSILLSRHVAPRNGVAIVLSIIASVRLVRESRKPKFRRSGE